MEMIKKLKAAGLRPNFHIIDNEVSTDLIPSSKLMKTSPFSWRQPDAIAETRQKERLERSKTILLMGCAQHTNTPH